MNPIKLALTIILTVAPFASAQTNTFPSSGNVGIGTTTPSSKLHLMVPGGDPNSAHFIISTPAGTGAANLRFGVNETEQYSWIQSHGSRPLRINPLGNNTILNLNSGNVGIGAASPSEQLVVGSSADSPNIKLSRWAYLGQESSHLTTVLGGNAKASGGSTVVGQSTVDGYRAVRMKYDEGITFHAFYGSVTAGQTVGHERMRISPSGNVGIGTSAPTHPLSVNGAIRAKEVIVDTGWSDFVFEDGYELPSLSAVEQHIEEHGHLPDIPSAAEVESEGLSVGEAQKLMMQKIEELTLYLIEKDKQVSELTRSVAELKEENDLRRREIDALKGND